jgi:hypothetical protein
MGIPRSVLLPSLAALALALLLGVFLARRRRAASRMQRALALLLPVATLFVLWTTVGLLVEAPWHHWIAVRLLPSAALLEGHELYTLPGQGALNGWIYPPVFPLVFLATMWIPELTLAIYASALLSAAALVVPLFLLVRRVGGVGLPAWAAFVCAWCGIAGAFPSRNILAGVHVDALAVGLGLLSLTCLVGTGGAVPSGGRLWLSALCAALAAFTKQVELPLVLAETGFLAAVYGRRTALRFLGLAACAGLGLGLLFAAVFGLRGMLLNAFLVPMRHPFLSLRALAPESAREFLPWIAAFVAVLLLFRRRLVRPLSADYTLVFLAALCLLPTSILARAKHGGWLNSYHSQPYLVAALALVLLAAARGLGERARWGMLAALSILALAVLPLGRARFAFRRVRELDRNPERLVSEFARAHPGRAYFPCFPLAVLRGEGRLYHLVWGINDRELGGYSLSDAELRAGIPPHPEYVIIEPGARQDVLRRLPEFRTRTRLPELPGWEVFTR